MSTLCFSKSYAYQNCKQATCERVARPAPILALGHISLPFHAATTVTSSSHYRTKHRPSRRLHTDKMFVLFLIGLAQCLPPKPQPPPPHITQTFVLLLISLARFLPPPAPKPSPICRIPVDSLLLVADELPLDSKYLLSQTCKRIHAILHRDWLAALQKLPTAERRLAVGRLAYHLPDYFSCASCCKLHKVDVNDIPTSSNIDLEYTRRGCSHVRKCRYVSKDHHQNFFEPYEFNNYYVLVHNHVQLALKYTRLGNTHTRYLSKLMQPYSLLAERKWLIIPPSLNVQSTETPKIVDGRFLYEMMLSMERRDGSILHHRDLLGWDFGLLCMNISLNLAFRYIIQRHKIRGRPDVGDSGLDRIARDGAPVQRLSCHLCRADFRFRLDTHRWVIHSWRDFGTETETVCNMRRDQWVRDGWTWEDVEHMSRPVAPFRPGDTESMYEGRELAANERGRSWLR